MKARIATLLSLTGVLVAGSAAALVNTQVLQSSAEQTTTTEVGALTASTTTAATPSSSTPLAADGRQEVRVGDAGTVTLDTAGGALAVVSVMPAPGWTVASSEPASIGGIEVHLVSATLDVRFNALLVDGQLVTDVGATQLGTLTSTPGTVPDDRSDDAVTSSSVHADDDESEDEHEDEDEHEGRDDDD